MTNEKRKGNVIGCRRLAIRKDPDVDVEVEDSNVKDSEDILCEVDKGTELIVDTSHIYYDWKDRAFYKVITPEDKEGYAPVAAIKMKEVDNERLNSKRRKARRRARSG